MSSARPASRRRSRRARVVIGAFAFACGWMLVVRARARDADASTSIVDGRALGEGLDDDDARDVGVEAVTAVKSVESAAADARRGRAGRETLKEILARGASDGGNCVGEAKGRFYSRSFDVVAEVERRIREREGFGWARWGDAEMAASARAGSPMQLAVRALMSKSATPNCVLNVGVHWLCSGSLRGQWNDALASESEADLEDTAGHAFFFLPMGDPADDDRDMWKSHGIYGYTSVIRESKRKVILLGPPHVKDLPFIGHDAFVDASGSGHGGDGQADDVVHRVFEIGDAMDEPPVVIMAAGMAAKTAILTAQDRIDARGWGFIDAGTTLDGYAGVKSRDYNDPAKYCRKTRERQRHEGDGVDFWFKPGVCDRHP